MNAVENCVLSVTHHIIEIINKTRGSIEAKIWERANGGQI